jgi:hypothetical protein
MNIWFIVAATVFIFIIIAMLFNFLSAILNVIQAQGCFAVLLLALMCLPGLFILCLAAGYTITSTIIVVASAISAVSGYIIRDSEGNVGKFGKFLMIISIIILVIALFASRMS